MIRVSALASTLKEAFFTQAPRATQRGELKMPTRVSAQEVPAVPCAVSPPPPDPAPLLGAVAVAVALACEGS